MTKNYEISSCCNIRNSRTKKILSIINDCVHLYHNSTKRQFRIYRLLKCSFEPTSIPENYKNLHIDHIDGNHTNNCLSNLQWLTPSEHAMKTTIQTKLSRKSSSKMRSKKVEIVNTPNNSDENLNRVFDSVAECSRITGIPKTNIFRSAQNTKTVSNGYLFKYVVQKHLENEIFTQTEESIRKYGGRIFASNFGRIETRKGVITKGSVEKGRKYRRIKLRNKSYMSHIVVWECHFGLVPADLVVMHNDSIDTLDEQSCERNYITDLSLGTVSENNQSCWDNIKKKRKVT